MWYSHGHTGGYGSDYELMVAVSSSKVFYDTSDFSTQTLTAYELQVTARHQRTWELITVHDSDWLLVPT